MRDVAAGREARALGRFRCPARCASPEMRASRSTSRGCGASLNPAAAYRNCGADPPRSQPHLSACVEGRFAGAWMNPTIRNGVRQRQPAIAASATISFGTANGPRHARDSRTGPVADHVALSAMPIGKGPDVGIILGCIKDHAIFLRDQTAKPMRISI